MKRHLATIIALFALATTLCAEARSLQPPTIRVGSYNIRLQPGDKKTPNAWNERKADFLNLLRKMDLDAFGLQEVCPGQAEFITNNLPQYVLVGEHRNADRVSGEASPVLYRKDRFEALKCGSCGRR